MAQIKVKSKSCPDCGDVKELTVTDSDYTSWKAGALIQRAFPYLNTDDRERLITGYCPSCFAKIFADDEEFE